MDSRGLRDTLRRKQAENLAFFYAIDGDDVEDPNANVFWADAKSQENYVYFGDAVRFDTCYRDRHYNVPLVAFTGLNHHAQPVLFGCALLFNVSDASLVWILQTWLTAMSGRCPVSITTDLDSLITAAVAHVLPKARHRFSGWSVFKETEEKLASIYQNQPVFMVELKKCTYEAETIEEFDSSWHSLLGRYHLLDNDWLRSMYNARHQWVPVYMKCTFYGEFSSAGGNCSMNSFFVGFVNDSTTIGLLIEQCEKAVASWHEREGKADMDTINVSPVLRTPSLMEKQAANLYTRNIFTIFQGELVETLAYPASKIDDAGAITVYRVAKFGDEHRVYIVSFDAREMRANCSCQMFEFSGVLCRHILSVFRAKNVLTLPTQYILRRWTRNAKICSVEHSHESRAARYNNLCEGAVKFVEEGAKSIHVYNVAKNALQEAGKKVAAAKKKSSEAIQRSNQANEYNLEDHAGRDNAATASTHISLGQKERKIRELMAELQRTNHRCEVYRANLLSVLKDMEDQKLKLSVKVQNARLSLKTSEH